MEHTLLVKENVQECTIYRLHSFSGSNTNISKSSMDSITIKHYLSDDTRAIPSGFQLTESCHSLGLSTLCIVKKELVTSCQGADYAIDIAGTVALVARSRPTTSS